MSTAQTAVSGFVLQDDPQIICAKLPGDWLLEHTTPSWRIRNPVEGFQRMVDQQRAQQIALAVLDQRRTFPNAIVLATDIDSIGIDGSQIILPDDAMFLVVDGQHRLRSQQFSKFNAPYACLIHTGLSLERMAELFVEINNNQKRVPSSLRWDLIRLIKPDDDPHGMAAAELVYLLATEDHSPFYQRIDLTGEQSEMQIKQGSLAPEFRELLRRRTPLSEMSFIEQHGLILEYSIAIQQVDADRWGTNASPFFKARVLRALFRLMRDLVNEIDQPDTRALRALDFIPYLERIDADELAPDKIRAMQGSAGMAAIYKQIKDKALPG